MSTCRFHSSTDLSTNSVETSGISCVSLVSGGHRTLARLATRLVVNTPRQPLQTLFRPVIFAALAGEP